MGFLGDVVISGDYMGADIKTKGLKNNKVYLIHKSLFGKKEILLNRTTVKDIRVLTHTISYNVEITFHDGKKCVADLTNTTFAFLQANF